jgi:hypothetical protein
MREGLARGDSEWSLNEAHRSLCRGVRVSLGTGDNRVRGAWCGPGLVTFLRNGPSAHLTRIAIRIQQITVRRTHHVHSEPWCGAGHLPPKAICLLRIGQLARDGKWSLNEAHRPLCRCTRVRGGRGECSLPPESFSVLWFELHSCERRARRMLSPTRIVLRPLVRAALV